MTVSNILLPGAYPGGQAGGIGLTDTKTELTAGLSNPAAPATGFSEILAQRLSLPTSQNNYDGAFVDAGRQFNVNPALLKAIASAESGFNPGAVSPAGAVGLMQIMPGTAQQLGIDPRDPVQSVYGAANYLRSLLDRFNGNTALAVAAYNAGPGAVARYNGIPPFQETQDYVERVAGLMDQYGSGSTGSDSTGSASGSGGTLGSVPGDTGSQPDAAGLADLLLMWTEAASINDFAALDSDDQENSAAVLDL
jgi:hypothetical protein